MQREYVRNFINECCIHRATQKSFRLLKKGAVLGSDDPRDYFTWLFNLRPALYDPKIMSIINQHFYETFPKLRKYQLAGMEHASTAMITSFVLGVDYELPAFSIRKQKKTYGTQSWFEGYYDPTRPTIILDDIASLQQNTLMHGYSVLKDTKFKHEPEFYCIVNIAPKNTNVKSMFVRDDFNLEIN